MGARSDAHRVRIALAHHPCLTGQATNSSISGANEKCPLPALLAIPARRNEGQIPARRSVIPSERARSWTTSSISLPKPYRSTGLSSEIS